MEDPDSPPASGDFDLDAGRRHSGALPPSERQCHTAAVNSVSAACRRPGRRSPAWRTAPQTRHRPGFGKGFTMLAFNDALVFSAALRDWLQKRRAALDSAAVTGLSRRELLLAAGGAAIAASPLARAVAASAASFGPAALPAPAKSGLDHIILVTMENRSFDHFMGWLPGADGKQAGLSYADSNGVSHPTHPLAPDFQGCAYLDPDHSYDGARIEFDNGACDGFLRAAQRRLRDRLLPPEGSAVPRQGRARLDGVRPLLRRDPRADVPEPPLPAQRRRPTGSRTRSPSRRCRRSGTAWRRRA